MHCFTSAVMALQPLGRTFVQPGGLCSWYQGTVHGCHAVLRTTHKLTQQLTSSGASWKLLVASKLSGHLCDPAGQALRACSEDVDCKQSYIVSCWQDLHTPQHIPACDAKLQCPGLDHLGRGASSAGISPNLSAAGATFIEIEG